MDELPWYHVQTGPLLTKTILAPRIPKYRDASGSWGPLWAPDLRFADICNVILMHSLHSLYLLRAKLVLRSTFAQTSTGAVLFAAHPSTVSFSQTGWATSLFLREFVELPSSSLLARVRVVACCTPCPVSGGITWDPEGSRGIRRDPGMCSFWLEFETPIGLERFAISDERPLSDLSVRTFKNTMFLMTLLS